MIRIVISGIAGRMGQSILKTIVSRGHTLVSAIEAPSSPHIGESAGRTAHLVGCDVSIRSFHPELLSGAEGIIDFTAPNATMDLLEAAVSKSIPMVIGTTGFSAPQKERITAASRSIPVLFSPNMSVGVNVLFRLTEVCAKILKGGYDIEIFEAHHRHKKDAPSGTAKRLAEIIKNSVEELKNSREVHDRWGLIGERTGDEIGFMSLRGGDIVGEHTVFFVGEGERIELTHRATNRDNLALGAVLGLEHIVDREPGLYSMSDVLGL